jgi:hypothetical protein
MSFIRGLCLGLIGFLLFFCLLAFSLILTLRVTILQPEFMVKELDKLNIPVAAREFLGDQMLLDETYVKAIDNTLVEIEPWIRQQINEAVFSSYDYWLGKNRTFRIRLDLDPLRNSLVDNLTEVYLQSPPPEYLKLPPSEQKSYLASLRQDTLDLIPSTLEIDKDNLGEDIKAVFTRARETIFYLNIAFWGLLAALLLLAILLILTARKIKGILLSCGLLLTADGALILVAIRIISSKVYPRLISVDLISELQIWLSTFLQDTLFPWKAVGIALLIAGVLSLLVYLFITIKKPVPE